ncbi:hypothetical protein Gpo141_00014819 [Globisporangium polare]
MAANSPQLMPMLTIQGSLEDAMYGTYFDDTSSLRSRSTYEKDLVEDMAVLRNIDAPMVDDPFNYLGVSRFLCDLALQLFAVDQVGHVLVGEPIGVYLVHSIYHRELPEMDFANIVRGRLAFCLIYHRRRHCLGISSSGEHAPPSPSERETNKYYILDVHG